MLSSQMSGIPQRRISIVAVDDDPNALRMLSETIATNPQAGLILSGMAQDRRVGLDTIRMLTPDLVIIDSVIRGEQGAQLAHQVRQEFPRMGIIMTLDDHESSIYQTVSQSQLVDEVLVKPYDAGQMLGCISATWQKIQSAQPQGAPQPNYGAIDPNDFRPSSFVKRTLATFYSNKGGVGKTFSAIQTAVLLAKNASQPPLNAKVALLDFNFMNSAVGMRLNLLRQPNVKTVMDVVAAIRELNPQLLEQLMMTHAESGLKVMLAPGNPLDADDIHPDHISKIIDVARRTFDVVILDVNPYPKDPATLMALQESDRVYVVVTPDIDCIAANKQIVDVLAPVLQGAPGKLKVVVNEKTADTTAGITTREIAEVMKAEIVAEVPLNKELVRSASNRGQVPVLVDRGDLVRAFAQIANDLIPLKAAEPQKRSGLGRLFGR